MILRPVHTVVCKLLSQRQIELKREGGERRRETKFFRN